MTKKWTTVALLMALALPISATPAMAQTSQPSSKVTAKTAAIQLVPATSSISSWQTVLSNKIKTANQKDLFVGVSLQVGLYTKTLVRSKDMVPDQSTADASVKARVLIDGVVVAEPGDVVLGRRAQTLTATLQGAIDLVTLTTAAPEVIDLVLDSMDAASFNFVAPNVPQGTHTVEVQVQVDTSGSKQQGSFAASATVGKGSMTVESVRLVKGEDVILEVQ